MKVIVMIAVIATIAGCVQQTPAPPESSIGLQLASGPLTEANKKLVLDFYDMALNQHKPREAVAQYVGEQYTQHNPGAPDGPEAFITFFEGFFATTPTFKVEVKRVIAEGDLVVIHSHAKQNENDRGSAVVDIFRVADGKVVEHWDVIQPVPENPANTNTMF